MRDLTNKDVIHVNKNGIEYLQFKKLLDYQDIIQHAYGLGTDISYRVAKINNEPIPEEEYKQACQNYKKLCEAINLNYNNIVTTRQEHTDNIKIIEQKINNDAPDFNLSEYAEIDGLITNKKNIILAKTNADCILIILFDPIKKVIANIHSGWKGTLQRISVKTVEKMQQGFDCNPQNIICCFCPSIRKCHFEVEKDVAEMFYREFENLEQMDEIIEQNGTKNKWNIDTVLINKIILAEKGLKGNNIIDSGICSVCNKELIHSYRAEKEEYGLSTAIIGIQNNYNKNF